MSTPQQPGAPAPPDATALAAAFASAEPLALGGDRPFLLRGDNVWLVTRGQVDVFAVRLSAGEPTGPRVHLLRATQGQVLFGTGLDGAERAHGLLAVGANNSQARRMPQAALGSATALAGACAEPWIAGLYEAMTRDRLPAISTELVPGREAEVRQGASVRLRGEVGFVRQLEGFARFMGQEGLELPADGLMPLSRQAWLEAGADSRLVALETRELPDAQTLWAALARLNELALRYVRTSDEATERAALERVRQKEAFRDAVLRDSCERLAATMTPGASPLRAPAAPAGATEDLEDPLFASCAAVGAALALTMKPYVREQGAPPPRDPLAAILRASRVRARQVALRGNWWLEDNGPLLAHVAEGKRPVALLRASAAGPYVLHDAPARSQRPVDAALAETLEPFAHTFYRTFPETPLKMRDVLRFAVHGCSRDLWVVVAVAIGSALLAMVPAMATGMLFNTVIPGAQRSQLLQITFVLLACAATNALLNLAQGVALLRVEGRAGGSLQAAVWDRLLALPLNFFRPYTAGDLAVRAMSIDSIRQVISGSTVQALVGGVQALGNFGLMFWYSWRMGLWATLVIGLVLGVTLLGSVRQLRPQREAQKQQSKAAGVVLQLLSSIGKLRIAGVEVQAFALWARRFGDLRRLQQQGRAIAKWVTSFNAAVPVASYLVIFYVGLSLVQEGTGLATGDFLAFLSAYSASSSSLIATSLALLATLNTLPLYEQAKPILEALPEVNLGKSDPGVLTGDIEIQHALFRYSQDGPLVLRDVSLRIRAGEFVAFVGPSGSGKSTLLRLLLGFENLEAGSVYYDGQEIGGLDVLALRRQMGVVLQSGRMMSGDIYTNIVGSATASLDEAWEAARMAGLAEDIEAMPMGMHTVLSEGASTLSGGQRQRLLIARAIVARPRILLFDEATSALDNRTQAIVSQSLEKLQATRIVVAHRLSTIINADKIFVLERGRLVQSGSYAELMAQPGPFAELAKRQIA